LRLKFFDATGHLDGPPVVTEVPADLAHHGRHGEVQKVCAVVDVDPIDRVEQADPGGLDQVVKWFAAATVSARNVMGQGQGALDDRFALTPEFPRPLIQRFEVAKHLRDVCIL
jgi:hypothetical protein